jgi:integrase
VQERRVAGVRPSTLSGYRIDRKHLAPLAGVRLARLTPERIGQLWSDLLAAGLSGGSVRHVRRTLSAALTTAMDRGQMARKPARLAPCPRDTTPDVTPLSAAEITAVPAAAGPIRNGVRWAVGLALELRQKEALGLQWHDLDLDTGILRVRRSLDRTRYHGCNDPTGHRAAQFPQRTGGGRAGPLKTKGSARTLALPSPLVTMLATAGITRRVRIHDLSSDTQLPP